MPRHDKDKEVSEWYKLFADGVFSSENYILFTQVQQELIAANEQLLAVEEELRKQLEEAERTREALANANHRLEMILDFLPDPTFVIDSEGIVTMWNRAMEDLTGIKAREMVGKGDYAYAVPFYGRRQPMLIDRALHKGRYNVDNGSFTGKPHIEVMHEEIFSPQLKAGGACLSCKAAPLLDYKNHVVGAIQTIRDITEQKRAEKILRESEEKFRYIVENIEDGYFEVDVKGNFTYFNNFLIGNIGYTRMEFQGLNFRKLMDEENGNLVFKAFNQVYRTGKGLRELSWEVRRKDGSSLYVESTVLPIIEGGKITGFRGIVRNVTERKKAEEALRKSERNLQKQVKYLNTLIDNMNELFLTYDKDGRISFVNKRSLEVIGYAFDEVLGRYMLELVAPDDYIKAAVEIDKCLKQGKDSSYEVALIHKEGREIILKMNAAPIIDEEGNITGGMVLAEDITEKKKALKELEISEAKYRAIVEDQTELIMRLDDKGNIDFVNEAFCRYYRMSRDKITRVKFIDLVYEKDREYTENALQTLNLMKSVCNIESRVRMPDGEVRWQQWTHRAIFDRWGKLLGYQSVGRDITEWKKTEERLQFLSCHDALTGLYNRFYFEEQMQRVEKSGSMPVGLIMCDVDGLKIINDTLGHDKGDSLLKSVAEVLTNSFRREDTIARVGGDEFAVLLPGTDRKALEKAVNRLRSNIRDYNEKNSGMLISLSIGYAAREAENTSMQELFRQADNAMYREKLHSGQSVRNSIVQTLTKALEARDFITEGHGERMQDLVVAVAEELGLPENTINDLRIFAQFHDIGKVGIPDAILFKPGPLTAEEYQIMKGHSEIGYRIALAAPELVFIADWILKHHEWWNGKGYPLGLRGNQIPLECRILSIADAYDAMTNDRPYRRALSPEEAIAELRRCAGIQFDPYLVEEFVFVLKKKGYK
ncbi:PAS domain S-box-containing protein/diguanylate cyclase (GGDEF) domain-containing protein [Thermosyntropha lipolytica DSM 11003]|uniref:PAS domain S-box-containing protein/diguanylate cyclase (GGDEF) domain-containing protein n=1 Tax=Thermosyntropha lipolytica DSM 11003 TaxID=1123382 RepID=A0A1M5M3Y0_9FIRM|nr:PAS domain S-box protein [Thermosyntropha lipolytica]SHG72007.1 PAS domain S-box-containing protein/diguanylate cyclase (GGDEF) domain-containing protein [Thermosyntropha lipolytica DSM 11003]